MIKNVSIGVLEKIDFISIETSSLESLILERTRTEKQSSVQLTYTMPKDEKIPTD